MHRRVTLDTIQKKPRRESVPMDWIPGGRRTTLMLLDPSNVLVQQCEALNLLLCEAEWTFIDNPSWGPTLPCAQWQGVTCDADGHVINLNISNKLNGGSVPSYLANLGYLTTLDVSSNGLFGRIPTGLTRLTRLANLNLAFNSFIGDIPSNLGSITRLTSLKLSSNNLEGTLFDPSRLVNLQNLDVGFNSLTGFIPDSITTLSALTALNLRSNYLTGIIPPGLSALTNLLDLFLDNNQLTGTLANVDALASIFMPNGTRNDLSSNFIAVLSPSAQDTSGPRNATGFAGICDASGGVLNLQLNCIEANQTDACPFGVQRTILACDQFCGASSGSVCSGFGTCSLNLVTGIAECTCIAGYKRDLFNPGNCVDISTEFPPPLTPPTTDFGTGIDFNRKVVDSYGLLSRQSRYLGSSVSYNAYFSYFEEYNATQDPYNIPPISYWMAPKSVFIQSSYPDIPECNRFQNYYCGYCHSCGCDGECGSTLSFNYVQDQGECASCWATATADSIAAVQAIASGSSLVKKFSTQQLQDCVLSGTAGNCTGDFPYNAMQYAVERNLLTEEEYSTSTCPEAGAGVPPILLYEEISFQGSLGILLVLQNQPVNVLIEGTSMKNLINADYTLYCANQSAAVFADTSCYTGNIDHQVLIVGYDLKGRTPYYVIRNSWGVEWCRRGYFRMAINGPTEDGICGVYVNPAFYPIATPRALPPQQPFPDRPPFPPYPPFPPLSPPRPPYPPFPPYPPHPPQSPSPPPFVPPPPPPPPPPDGFVLDVCNAKGIIPLVWPKPVTRAAMSPCGDGFCIPRPDWGRYSYECDCENLGQFVNVNNTVILARTLPDVGLGITQSCVLDPCLYNTACDVGTCFLTSNQTYSCLCPTGFSVTTVNGLTSCVLSLSSGPQSYTTQPGVTCGLVAATFALPLAKLQEQNPGKISCLNSPNTDIDNGTVLDVTNTKYSCSVVYRVTESDITTDGGVCAAVVARLTSKAGSALTKKELEDLNPWLDCNDNSSIKAGLMICIKGGSWTTRPSCIKKAPPVGSTCKSVIENSFATNPILFYDANRGIDCDTFDSTLGGIFATQTPVCLSQNIVGATDCSQLNADLTTSRSYTNGSFPRSLKWKIYTWDTKTNCNQDGVSGLGFKGLTGFNNALKVARGALKPARGAPKAPTYSGCDNIKTERKYCRPTL